VSKVVSLKTKLLKKTKLQLLWIFELSAVPRTHRFIQGRVYILGKENQYKFYEKVFIVFGIL